jgi:hypothetical protein
VHNEPAQGRAPKRVGRFKAETLVAGAPVQRKFASTYGSAMTRDGRYFGSGARPRDGIGI